MHFPAANKSLCVGLVEDDSLKMSPSFFSEERNVSLRRNLVTMKSQMYIRAGKELKNTTQQLIKSQSAIQVCKRGVALLPKITGFLLHGFSGSLHVLSNAKCSFSPHTPNKPKNYHEVPCISKQTKLSPLITTLF
jgi:hypothetical protein